MTRRSLMSTMSTALFDRSGRKYRPSAGSTELMSKTASGLPGTAMVWISLYCGGAAEASPARAMVQASMASPRVVRILISLYVLAAQRLAPLLG